MKRFLWLIKLEKSPFFYIASEVYIYINVLMILEMSTKQKHFKLFFLVDKPSYNLLSLRNAHLSAWGNSIL